MPPGAVFQQSQPLFRSPDQIPPQMHQQLYRQFLGEQMGFLKPMAPGSYGGIMNMGQQQKPQKQQGQQQQPQQQQPQQPQQQPQMAQPMQPPSVQPVQMPTTQQIAPTVPTTPYAGPMGVAPNPYMGGVGQSIGASSSPAAGYLGNVLFGG